MWFINVLNVYYILKREIVGVSDGIVADGANAEPADSTHGPAHIAIGIARRLFRGFGNGKHVFNGFYLDELPIHRHRTYAHGCISAIITNTMSFFNNIMLCS